VHVEAVHSASGDAAPAFRRAEGALVGYDVATSAEPRADVRAAFAALREQKPRRAALVFGRFFQTSAALADWIAEELAKTEGLAVLALVHPTADVGLLAATLRLRAPRTRVVAASSLALADSLTREGPP
jgi:hypothetical protein